MGSLEGGGEVLCSGVAVPGFDRVVGIVSRSVEGGVEVRFDESTGAECDRIVGIASRLVECGGGMRFDARAGAGVAVRFGISRDAAADSIEAEVSSPLIPDSTIATTQKSDRSSSSDR